MHCSRKKKETQMMLFLTALWVFFFPWTCKAGEEEDFFLPCFSLPLSPKIQKDADPKPPLA
jgi:hypothetical protein